MFCPSFRPPQPLSSFPVVYRVGLACIEVCRGPARAIHMFMTTSRRRSPHLSWYSPLSPTFKLLRHSAIPPTTTW